MTKIDAIFLINFEAEHTHMADIKEYLPPVGQSQREVCQVNTSQSAWAPGIDPWKSTNTNLINAVVLQITQGRKPTISTCYYA